MKFIGNIACSVALHGAIIGTVSVLCVDDPCGEREIEIPVVFEIVPEASIDPGSDGEEAAPQPKHESESDAEQSETEEADVDDDVAEAMPMEDIPEADGVEENNAQPETKEVVLKIDSDVPEQQAKDDSRETIPEDETRTASSPPEDAVSPSAPGAGEMQEEERAEVVAQAAVAARIVPVYPRRARRLGREGVVVLEIEVSEKGEASRIAVLSSSGFKELDDAAANAVRSAKFTPAMRDGVGVSGKLELSFDFRLK